MMMMTMGGGGGYEEEEDGNDDVEELYDDDDGFLCPSLSVHKEMNVLNKGWDIFRYNLYLITPAAFAMLIAMAFLTNTYQLPAGAGPQ